MTTLSLPELIVRSRARRASPLPAPRPSAGSRAKATANPCFELAGLAAMIGLLMALAVLA
jgi:hypothetical protein